MKYLVFVSLAGSSLLGVKKDTMCEPLCDQLHGKRRFLSRSAMVLLQQRIKLWVSLLCLQQGPYLRNGVGSSMLWFFGELFAVTPPDIDISQLRDLQAVIKDGLWVITDDGSVSLTTRHVAWQQFLCCFHISLYLRSYIFSKSALLLLPPTQNKVPPSS